MRFDRFFYYIRMTMRFYFYYWDHYIQYFMSKENRLSNLFENIIWPVLYWDDQNTVKRSKYFSVGIFVFILNFPRTIFFILNTFYSGEQSLRPIDMLKFQFIRSPRNIYRYFYSGITFGIRKIIQKTLNQKF